ncbi:MAG TPA: hypothetical protein VGK73_28130 [Polyangiaceae bacterium]
MTSRRALIALLGGVLSAASGHAQARGPVRGSGPALLHVPAEQRRAEQGILTPVPVSVELPHGMPAARVLVHYRIFGAPRWTTLELSREGRSERFRGAIPCLEVSTITGDIHYYIRVHDEEGAVLAFSGSRAYPYVVKVIHPSERPDLARSGARCPDPADCPPGLIGCPSEVIEQVPCRSDADCEGGASCSWEGFCELVDRRKNWVSLDVSAAAGIVRGAGACSLHSQENEGYACYRESDGERYFGTPVYTNEPLVFARAPLRVLLGYERLVAYDTTVGARVGYAFFGGAPEGAGAGAFVPWSAELRATHFLGSDAFARHALSGFFSFAAGLSMFDLEGSVHVREDPSAPPNQGGNDLEQTLELWKRAGDGFVAAGTGVALWAGPGLLMRAEISASGTFPYSALILTTSVGAEVGF